MDIQVKLADIVDGMESSTEENLVLLNITTGEVVYLLQSFLRNTEKESPYHDLPDWQQEQMILANDVLDHNDNYVSLPSKFDFNEYGVIEEFCNMQLDRIQNQLLHAIRGKAAFGRFKDKIYDLNLDDNWYEFRDRRYKEIAIEFCEKCKLKYGLSKDTARAINLAVLFYYTKKPIILFP